MKKTRRKSKERRALSIVIFLLVGGGLAVAGLIWGPRLMVTYHTFRAEANLEAGETALAIEHLQWLLEYDTSDSALRMRLVDAYLALPNYTRAEYLLTRGMKLEAGHVEYYIKLCQIFVAQDKLWDAVELLDDPSNPFVKEKLDELRPAAPVFAPEPGTYNQQVKLAVTVGEGVTCRLTLNDTVPSAGDEPYTQPVALPIGRSDVRAVAVSADGLVSGWTQGTYRLENILQPVEFRDPALEAHFRALLEKPVDPIMSDELWAVKTLVLPEQAGYQTLEDLVFLPELTELSLYGRGQKIDLSPLSSLSHLQSLTLKNFRLDAAGLEFLGRMTELDTLRLQDAGIASLDFLSSLTGLTRLNLRGNNIVDAAPLAELTELRHLDLSQNAVEDTSPLAALVGLNTLIISENRLTDIRGLRTLTALETVDVSYNQASDLSPLSDHTALRSLLCTANPVESMAPLRTCVKLEILSASGGTADSVEPLSGCKLLRELTLTDMSLASLDGLSSCKALVTVDVSKNGITSVGPLSGLPALVTLRAEQNKIKTLEPLKNCPSLRSVYAFDNPLTDAANLFAGTNITVYRE